ncbi:hypothetical protein M378DRAFT_159998 [Amanita muscaria Koide BX008]|uniref:Uncharacterized protein n=1 Tax=Amanita muscaria (strain Koide BX008) TaxID=946122 RepID=A0A0C2TJ96_AMAMK|nr:hypothetical protein M378DRAFT_159998 [Amanita muscaria Koide BX008]
MRQSRHEDLAAGALEAPSPTLQSATRCFLPTFPAMAVQSSHQLKHNTVHDYHAWLQEL